MNEDTNEIKLQIAVGVTSGGSWYVADSGDAVPLGIEHQIDAVWEAMQGELSMVEGHEIWILDVVLPRPVRPERPHATPAAAAPAVRVDSKDAVLRGRAEALRRVLATCDLDEAAAARVQKILGEVDEDWDEVPSERSSVMETYDRVVRDHDELFRRLAKR